MFYIKLEKYLYQIYVFFTKKRRYSKSLVLFLNLKLYRVWRLLEGNFYKKKIN